MTDLALQLIAREKKEKTGKLDLGKCGLTELPEELFELEWLEELSLRNRQWDEKKQKWIDSPNHGPYNLLQGKLPDNFKRLKQLKKFRLGGSAYVRMKSSHNFWDIWKISDLTILEKLTHLEFLDLRYNRISNIDFLAKLTKLQYLDLSENKLSDISTLSNLKNLRSLFLSFNQLPVICPLKNLTDLQSLDLRSNQISNICPLEELFNLKFLNLRENNISNISPLLPLIKQGIQVLWERKSSSNEIILQNNPLSTPPIEIVREGNDAVLSYFRQIDEQGGTEPLYEAKLIIVGEAGAGKTSLMKKLIDPSYQVKHAENSDETSTVGINVHEGWIFSYLGEQEITFSTNLWDFGGQEIQYMTHQFFLTPSALYVLVADDRKQHTNFPYWFEIVHLLGCEDNYQSPILVVLNENNHRSITNFDHRSFRERYPETDIQLNEVDLSHTDQRYFALKEKIQRMLCELNHVGDPLPKQWKPIREKLKEIAKEQDHISWAEFSEVCAKPEHGITKEQDQRLLSSYLHKLGSILHFQQDSHLQDFIILSPQWAVDAVYSVLTNTSIKEKAGHFSQEEVYALWGDGYSLSEKGKLLSLMKKDVFEICYEITDGQYLAPQLLENVRPAFSWDENKSLKFRYQYRFMPKGIITRLIVRLNEYIVNENDNELVWEKGVLIEKDNCRAQIVEDETNKEGLKVIDIEVNGKEQERKYVLRSIREAIEALHKKWFPNIAFERMVPCICEICKDTESPTFFEYKELLQYQEEGEVNIKCKNRRLKNVNVRELLEGIFDEKEIEEQSRHREGNTYNIYGDNPSISTGENAEQNVAIKKEKQERKSVWEKWKVRIAVIGGIILPIAAVIGIYFTWKDDQRKQKEFEDKVKKESIDTVRQDSISNVESKDDSIQLLDSPN